ncbi:hypothetical protein NCAS_0I02270 [Naumovozyma castellii]|uniref:Uncharacterized protein n=1 Tax=Naumovozyma castellii TaxID=27288 RepID=G0VK61_NAUCA|nr:hypothetical protein NCAS_0I02270 [Naumovozyma castellii CBS 4309]CCC71895.1 hypothetical protein NCAS_0I02270 [Naumovozyma castellii CBS 4309]
MDDLSRLRVFEPLDTNSLSLISTTSSNNNNTPTIPNDSFQKSLNTPIIQKNENAIPLKWQLERKEFTFDSNSTPSKRKVHTSSGLQFGQSRLINVRKRKSQLIGAKPKVPSKLYQSSKLDLLDEDKFTSLPIAPPRDTVDDEERITNKKPRLNPMGEIRVHNTGANRHISYAVQDLNNIQNHDDSKEDVPIILVEDYITPNARKNGAKQRVSMSDLKTKLTKRNDNHIPLKLRRPSNNAASNPMMLVPHILEEEYSLDDSLLGGQNSMIPDSVHNLVDGFMKSHTSTSDDRYLQGLSIKTELKKCVVCECPLYEISSLIQETKDYKEIVCGSCTARYEEAAKIFEDFEFETSMEDSTNSTMSNLESPVELYPNSPWRTIENKSSSIFTQKEKIPKSQKKSKDQFSDELLRRLRSQLSKMDQSGYPSAKVHNNSKTLDWFLEAKKKIIEKTKLNGFLPFFVNAPHTATPETDLP